MPLHRSGTYHSPDGVARFDISASLYNKSTRGICFPLPFRLQCMFDHCVRRNFSMDKRIFFPLASFSRINRHIYSTQSFIFEASFKSGLVNFLTFEHQPTCEKQIHLEQKNGLLKITFIYYFMQNRNKLKDDELHVTTSYNLLISRNPNHKLTRANLDFRSLITYHHNLPLLTLPT